MRLDPDAVWDATDVAAYCKVRPRTVLEEYVKAPGFPEAIRPKLDGGRRGHPRWQATEVRAWWGKQRTRPGRPRKEV